LAGLSEVLKIMPDSLLYRLVGQPVLIAKYFCSYGVNEKYLKVLQDNGLIFTAESEEGDKRALEIADHPFYMGTLFQPALSTTPEQPDPLIEGFIRHVLEKSV
jgi:CTP synthase (UTP-ammonia lyase)